MRGPERTAGVPPAFVLAPCQPATSGRDARGTFADMHPPASWHSVGVPQRALLLQATGHAQASLAIVLADKLTIPDEATLLLEAPGHDIVLYDRQEHPRPATVSRGLHHTIHECSAKALAMLSVRDDQAGLCVLYYRDSTRSRYRFNCTKLIISSSPGASFSSLKAMTWVGDLARKMMRWRLILATLSLCS